MKALTKKEIKKFFKNKLAHNKNIILIIENVQNEKLIFNLLEISNYFGIKKVYLTGNSTTSKKLFSKFNHQINVQTEKNTYYLLKNLKKEKFLRVAIDLTRSSKNIKELSDTFKLNNNISFVITSKNNHLSKKTLSECDESVYIPFFGNKYKPLETETTLGIILNQTIN